jgi:hypothetical protein
MTLTEEEGLLESLVKEMVPDKFQPTGCEVGIVTNISLADTALMCTFGDTQDTTILGITLDWGALRTSAGLSSESPVVGKYGIFISKTATADRDMLSFILLHEVGHIDWFLKKKTGKEMPRSMGNSDLYADIYAFEVLKGHYGLDEGIKLLRRFGSSRGWSKYLNSIKEEKNG